MNLLVKANRDAEQIALVTPESAGWTYVGFEACRMRRGARRVLHTGTRELCIVVLRGVVGIWTDQYCWRDIGERKSVFENKSPYAVYVPGGTRVTIECCDDAEIALCTAPAGDGHEARLIEPGKTSRSVRGKGANTRYVCDILPQSEPAAHLLVVEVLTPAGHSSSYPPHKHDVDNIPAESFLEETYYHRLNPSQGFAFQRVYTDDRAIDQSMAVEDHDVVMVPRGYHPVVVPYGYDAYYLNVMAGPTRQWHFKNDPAHAWMLEH